MTQTFIPKNENATGITISFNSGPMPGPGDFEAKSINTARVGSSLNKTDEGRFVDPDEFENIVRGISHRESSAIPA